MNTKYKVNGLYRIAAVLFVALLSIFNFWEFANQGVKFQQLILVAILWWALIPVLCSYVEISNQGIKSVKIFFPKFWIVQQYCGWNEIEKIDYNFLLFEEIGNFVLMPKDNEADKTITINFLIVKKKEIIGKILEKRPDLEISDFIKDKVLGYRITRPKFALIAAIVITILIAIMVLQKILQHF